MSRSTQYIGLNSYALKFIEKATNIDEYEMTDGMDGEPIKGNIYHMPIPEGPNKEYRLVEVVQDVPWSGGPMIFTCLKEVIVKDSGEIEETGEKDHYFKWMIDLSLKDKGIEVDCKTGRYYA